MGVNTDSVASHVAYQKALGGLSFPLASDRWPYAGTAQAYGVFPPAQHPLPFINDRAVVVVDQDGKLVWSKVYELKQVPDVAEVLAVLADSR